MTSLSQHPAQLDDFSIWAVVVPAYSGREDKLRSGHDYPSQCSMRDLQSIHIYLKMDIVIEHVLGLVKMMALLGDLRRIKAPGIAQTVSIHTALRETPNSHEVLQVSPVRSLRSTVQVD